MTSIVGIQKPLDSWLNNYISPGRVGSVGDVNLQVELKRSNPDMPNRYYNWTTGKYEQRLGSNVQDGQEYSYDSGGLMARVIDENWNTNKTFKTAQGWYYQDLRPVDRTIEPVLGGMPQYSWLNSQAVVFNAKSTGNKFLPLPNGYAPGPEDQPRGGLIPRINPIGDVSLITSSAKGNYVARNPVVFS